MNKERILFVFFCVCVCVCISIWTVAPSVQSPFCQIVQWMTIKCPFPHLASYTDRARRIFMHVQVRSCTNNCVRASYFPRFNSIIHLIYHFPCLQAASSNIHWTFHPYLYSLYMHEYLHPVYFVCCCRVSVCVCISCTWIITLYQLLFRPIPHSNWPFPVSNST